jgi:hypothetical protein
MYYLKYYYGADELEILEIECTRDMMIDCLMEQFDTHEQRELVEILLENITNSDLFYSLEDLFLDYYKDLADDIRNNS